MKLPACRLLLCLLPLLAVTPAFAYDKDVVKDTIETQEKIAGLSAHTLTIEGQRIAYLDNELTRAPRTIVMVHGFGDSSLSWTFFARIFRDAGFRMVIPDLLGFGDSARPADGDYSYRAQARRLLALMQALKIPNAHVVGNSMGGGVAAEMAILQPDAVASLTLMDSAGVHFRPTALDHELMSGHNMLIAKTPEDFDHILDFAAFERPFTPRPVMDFLAERAVKDGPLHKKIFDEVLFPDIDFLLLDLPKIKAPTLIVWGEQDKVLSPENARVFQQYIPNAKLVTFPNVGHIPMIEIPEKSGAAVRDFINALTPGAVATPVTAPLPGV